MSADAEGKMCKVKAIQRSRTKQLQLAKMMGMMMQMMEGSKEECTKWEFFIDGTTTRTKH